MFNDSRHKVTLDVMNKDHHRHKHHTSQSMTSGHTAHHPGHHTGHHSGHHSSIWYVSWGNGVTNSGVGVCALSSEVELHHHHSNLLQ